MRICQKLSARPDRLSIQKRLTYSNILMFLIPVAVTLISTLRAQVPALLSPRTANLRKATDPMRTAGAASPPLLPRRSALPVCRMRNSWAGLPGTRYRPSLRTVRHGGRPRAERKTTLCGIRRKTGTKKTRPVRSPRFPLRIRCPRGTRISAGILLFPAPQ